jgi:hypothetical protein
LSGKPPDFAVARAIEILTQIYARRGESVGMPLSEDPILLFSETISIGTNVTTRADVERKLGIGFSYPVRGWHSYGVRGPNNSRLLLSLFYAKKRLAAAELYVPKVDRAPRLLPLHAHFRLAPSEVEVGAPVASLPEYFRRMDGMPTELGAFDDMFEARFPGGAAYAMGNGGTIERLALYAFAT